MGKFNLKFQVGFVFRDRYLLFHDYEKEKEKEVNGMGAAQRNVGAAHSVWLRSPIENHDEWLLE